MKLGLIARADNSGLGNQTWELFNHLQPAKTMVIKIDDARGLKQYPERYLDYGSDITFIGAAPSFNEAEDFLKGLDIVFMCETPYSFRFLKLARGLGIKTIVQPNYELAPWLANKSLPRPDVFGVPTSWHYKDFPKPKILLPLPIATERFKPNVSGSARHFLHVVGTPAANDRNGTRDLVNALEYIKSDIVVTITSMQKVRGSDQYVASMLRGKKLPHNVRVILDRVMPENYWDLYEGQEVLVMPRRYGGLCLPVNEALGAGMPTIMPNISPNSEWLPNSWLTEATSSFSFTPGRNGSPVEVYQTDPKVLAAKIDHFASNREFYNQAVADAKVLAEEYSWDRLKKLYMDTFDTMLKVNG